jgi:hypothetical protein
VTQAGLRPHAGARHPPTAGLGATEEAVDEGACLAAPDRGEIDGGGALEAEKPDALTAVSVKRIDRDGRDTDVTIR